MTSTVPEEFDYVVVGAGSAGCVVAARLSEDPDVSVALVEAGSPSRGRLFEIPSLFSQQQKGFYDWDFESDPEPNLGDRRIYLPRGRVMGGTSSMNTMLYVRGNRYDYDTWKSLGNKEWGYEDVLPFFKKSEDNERGADKFHGTGGPLTVSDSVSVHPLLTEWVEAAADTGYIINPDFNGEVQDGVGYHQVTQRHGLRCSTAVAFLEPARQRPNLTIFHSTLALRVGLDGNVATEIEVDHCGEVRTIHAAREIILSLGAYNTPHLLLQSGVGPADELAASGVAAVHDLPDVGRHLQDHVGCFLSFFSSVPPLVGPDTSQEETLLRNEGVGPMAWTEVGGFLYSSEDVPAPDIQVHAALGIVRDQGLAAPLDPGMSFGPYVARPASRGAVQLRHPHPYAKPRITHNYLADPDDLTRLRRGVRLCMNIARNSQLTSALGSDLSTAADAGLAPTSDRDTDIDEFIRTQSFSFYHPSGTCMMGKVVDHELRVEGLQNLRVADTSVMPTLVTGNTNAPAIMIGERAADFIKREVTSQA